ncbi:excalibur calcium-binding domain-containing protein [Streptomyces sp. NPDC059441]|uniref:excalibur calcium-binding domain-containing protein n=1 Tax=Streptomyces sp. NPDC059441 TaxID=3346829 RepID=UPI00368411F2
MTNPYTAPTPPTTPAADTRKLYKRKRVWVGGLAIFALGIMWGTQSGKDAAAANPVPKVTVTATATTTETAAPDPAPTVTETQKVKVKVTVTAQANAGSGTSGGSSDGGGSDDSSSVYYANCSEARAAGAAPIHRGEPGYASRLDRDGDGTACDS